MSVREVVMSRVMRSLVLAALAIAAAAPAATAADAAPMKQLDDLLAELWTTVLETPSAQNSFGTGGQEYACFDLSDAVAPFAPVSADSCTVKAGTWVFVTAYSVECSTFEGNGTTEAQLRACARAGNAPSAPAVTVDGRAVPVSETETPLLHIVLPDDNVFGLPAGTQGRSVGHGWVVLLHPLNPGTHLVTIGDSVVTEIIVEAGR